MSFNSISDTKIVVRHFEVNSGKLVNKTDVHNGSLSFTEVGPSFDLITRRDKMASEDMYKNACKQPKLIKTENKKDKKNIYSDEFGQMMGKVYLQQ